MRSAPEVLKDLNLAEIIIQFQNGLPAELVEITRLADSIVITPCFIQMPTVVWPNAYLSNIPSRFINTPYLHPYKPRLKRLPNYILFFNDHFKEPTMPLHLSIVENNIKHVQMWIKHKPEWLTPAPLKLAAICGHLEIVKRLVNASKAVWTPEAMDLAAMNGHLDVVKYLHGIENGPGCTTEAMDGAATYGHLEVVVFLNENRSEGCTAKALQGAVMKGYAKVVEYLLNHRHERYFSNHTSSIREYYRIGLHRAKEEKDYIGVIRCLHNNSIADVGEDLILTAVKYNPLPTIKFLDKENIYGMTSGLLYTLIEIGDKDAIRYALEMALTENNKPISLLDQDNERVDSWTPMDNPEVRSRPIWARSGWSYSNAMDIAATFADLDTIKLLHRTGIKCCTVEAMKQAAATGRLDIVQWLHTHRTEGCTDDAMTSAIGSGCFEMVQWLHEVRGLNCTRHGLNMAADSGNAEMVSYLISLPMVVDTDPLPRYTAVDRAASNGHINIVELLKDYPATTNAMDRAAYNGHLDMVKYLHTHRTEGCTIKAYKAAVRYCRLDILEYLTTNNCCRDAVDIEQICIEAAGCNNLNTLEYCMNLLKADCTPKLRQLIMYKATMCNLVDTIKWLHEVKGFGWTTRIQRAAQIRGYKAILRYFDSIGDCQENCVLDDSSTAQLMDSIS